MSGKAEKANNVWVLLGKQSDLVGRGSQGLPGSSDHTLKTAELHEKKIKVLELKRDLYQSFWMSDQHIGHPHIKSSAASVTLRETHNETDFTAG